MKARSIHLDVSFGTVTRVSSNFDMDLGSV